MFTQYVICLIGAVFFFRPKTEIEKALEDAGFTIKTVYGHWAGSEFTETSPEMLFLAQK